MSNINNSSNIPSLFGTPTAGYVPTSDSSGNGTWQPLSSTGTWTPGIAFGGASTGITYAAQAGQYTIIGNIFYYDLYIVISNVGSATGPATVTGLPVTVATNIATSVTSNASFTLPAGYTTSYINWLDTTTTGAFYAAGSASGTSLDNTAFTAGTSIRAQGFIFI